MLQIRHSNGIAFLNILIYQHHGLLINTELQSLANEQQQGQEGQQQGKLQKRRLLSIASSNQQDLKPIEVIRPINACDLLE